jgi:hypothetical protein
MTQTALTDMMTCKKHKFVVSFKARDGSYKKRYIIATDAYSAGEIARKEGDVRQLYDVSLYNPRID